MLHFLVVHAKCMLIASHSPSQYNLQIDGNLIQLINAYTELNKSIGQISVSCINHNGYLSVTEDI